MPLMVQVTVETTGTLLVGTDIAAASIIVDALDVPVMGLNCATGPKEMAEHIRHLSQTWQGLISVQPNAGLPELRCGHTHYPLGPDELAAWLRRFVEEDGINFVGGCCGTEQAHIAALDAMLRGLAEDGFRPRPKARSPRPTPSVASLFSAQSLRQENAYLAIGERCNANGSRKFRELQEKGDWDGCVAMGREQVREGAHALDVCTAFVGRDEMREMGEVIARMRGQVDSPLVINSTELPVIEAALELYGGKAVINSINFEDGEEPPAARLRLAKKFGAAVIALTIDETGMAKTAEDKLRVAHRLVDFACHRHGLPKSDLLIDPLTFTICTGNEDDRKLGLWTLEAIEAIRAELPEVQIILGLSNISFGLNPAARHVLNSVMLDHALRRGLTGAIAHPSKILPLHRIAPEEVKAAEDLIFDRRAPGYDPLQAFIALFADRKADEASARARPETIEERLKLRIVDGDKQGLEAELDEAMQVHPPLAIINDILLDGMKTVGDLFGAGKMQLPFVLQSAETMKKAVAHLEPHLEKVEGQQKGTVVAGDGQGRRPRHRQEPGRHHPDQQRLSGRQSGHQAASGQHPGGRHGASRRRHRHVGSPGQIDRHHARESRGDGAPGPAHAGPLGRGGADPRLCRGGLLQGLWRGAGGLCPRRLRWPGTDGQGRPPHLRGPRPGAGRAGPEPQPQEAAHRARQRHRRHAGPAGRCRRDPLAAPRAEPRRSRCRPHPSGARS